MPSTIRHKLPSGFRHLFSHKEIRELKNQMNVRFDDIGFGHITNTSTYNKEKSIHSDFHPISINARKDELGWIFNIYQSGFRAELLPSEFDTEAKTKITTAITNYIKKIDNSKETDLLKRPQLWLRIQVINNQVELKVRELN